MHRRHAIDRQHVRGDAVGHLVLVRERHDLLEGPHHDRFEPAVHGFFVPEVPAPVLDPFEVAHRDTAGVRQDVRVTSAITTPVVATARAARAERENYLYPVVLQYTPKRRG